MKKIKLIVSIFVVATMVFSMTAVPAHALPTSQAAPPLDGALNLQPPGNEEAHSLKINSEASRSLKNNSWETFSKDKTPIISGTFGNQIPSANEHPGIEESGIEAVDITADFKDPNFLAAVREILGKAANEPIFDTDVSGITELWVTYYNIKDLAGLEHFVWLEEFYCYFNQIEILPALPPSLKYLDCDSNQLSALPALPGDLEGLDCSNNSLKALPNVLPSGLISLNCGSNQLTTLPVLPSGLMEFYCNFNPLVELPALPLGLKGLACSGNPQIVLPDSLPPGLERLFCSDNQLATLPALPASLTWLFCNGNQLKELPVLPLGLVDLDCSNNLLQMLDVSNLEALGTLYCDHNQLTEIVLNSSAFYWYIDVSFNFMENEAAVTGQPIVWDGYLFVFSPQYAKATEITDDFKDLNFRAAVREFLGKDASSPIYDIEVSWLTWLDVSYRDIADLAGLEHFTSLRELNCYHDQLTLLPALPLGLERLECSYNQLIALPNALPPCLTYLRCAGNQLASLPELPSSLTYLRCADNQLTTLPALPASLTELYCDYNQLTALPELPSGLKTLYCYNNQLEELPALPLGLELLDCDSNQLTVLPNALPPSLTYLRCIGNQLTMLPELPSGLKTLLCYNNQLEGLPILPIGLEELDCSYNPLKALPNALPPGLTTLDCYNNQLEELPILPLGLKRFDCSRNSLIALPNALPLSLTYLYCFDNQLTALPTLPASLERLDCSYNPLKMLPNTLPTGLTYLRCAKNQLTILPALPTGLTTLDCYNNQLEELPILPLGLEWLDCDGNRLTVLPTLPGSLTGLYCNDNLLTGIDLTGLREINSLYCYGNYIPSLDSVIGWRELGLELNSPENPWSGTFQFYNQRHDRAAVGVRTPGRSYINKDVEYTVSVANAVNVQEVELTFEFDGSMLAGKGLAGLGGFGTNGTTSWVYLGDDIWEGNQTIRYSSGEGAGSLTSTDPVDIAKIVFAPRTEGEATVKLTSVRVAGKDGAEVVDLSAIIGPNAATTAIELVYSKYDLNRDGTVDALDLGIMLLYCGSIEDSVDWASLVMVNDSKGVGVTASMCDVNGDGRIDMLDLLDLFIHYGAPGWFDPDEPDKEVICGL